MEWKGAYSSRSFRLLGRIPNHKKCHIVLLMFSAQLEGSRIPVYYVEIQHSLKFLECENHHGRLLHMF